MRLGIVPSAIPWLNPINNRNKHPFVPSPHLPSNPIDSSVYPTLHIRVQTASHISQPNHPSAGLTGPRFNIVPTRRQRGRFALRRTADPCAISSDITSRPLSGSDDGRLRPRPIASRRTPRPTACPHRMGVRSVSLFPSGFAVVAVDRGTRPGLPGMAYRGSLGQGPPATPPVGRHSPTT